jgi:hypothetical protein
MKKTQLWYLDFIFAVTMFTLILIMGFRYIANSHLIPGKETDSVLLEADIISQSLMTSGIPVNWTVDYVIVPGITTHNILNLTKIESLKNLTCSNYTHLKYMMGIKSDFIIYFEDQNRTILNLTNQSFIGRPGYTPESINNSLPEGLVTIVRYIGYKHDDIADIISMKVMVWQE